MEMTQCVSSATGASKQNESSTLQRLVAAMRLMPEKCCNTAEHMIHSVAHQIDDIATLSTTP
jgi:hypothetical protein